MIMITITILIMTIIIIMIMSTLMKILMMFAIMIFGYNQAVAGGVLTTASFNRQFPEMDVIDATGPQKHYNSTIQGKGVPATIRISGVFDN